jgi:tetratricopeptide (TPR) repeat protein
MDLFKFLRRKNTIPTDTPYPLAAWCRIQTPPREVIGFTYVDPEAGWSAKGAAAGTGPLADAIECTVRLGAASSCMRLSDDEVRSLGLPAEPFWLEHYGPQDAAAVRRAAGNARPGGEGVLPTSGDARTLSARDQAAELMKQALAHERGGRAAEAVAAYDRAITVAPRMSILHSNKAKVLIGKGERAEALKCVERAISLNGHNASAWHDKGTLLRDAHKPEEALACFDRDLAVNPKHMHGWYNKGGALMDLERLQEALPCFEEALRLGAKQAQNGITYCRAKLRKVTPSWREDSRMRAFMHPKCPDDCQADFGMGFGGGEQMWVRLMDCIDPANGVYLGILLNDPHNMPGLVRGESVVVVARTEGDRRLPLGCDAKRFKPEELVPADLRARDSASAAGPGGA